MKLLTCGSFSLEDMFGKVPPPPPPALEDKSSFRELPIEEQLKITQRELISVKDALRIKDVDVEDLKHELQFYSIKNEELMDVVNTFRCPSETKSYELMKAKSEQNSELTLQVHSLRDLLDKSGTELEKMQKKISSQSSELQSLSTVKNSNQRLQVQLNGLMKTLNNVEVSSVDIPSEWINAQWMTMKNGEDDNKENNNDNNDSNTIQLITRKIIAMEADRQRLLKESMLMNQSDTTKEDRILELERQVRQMQYDQDELQETNSALRKQMNVREGKIQALEELFQNINANRSFEQDLLRSPQQQQISNAASAAEPLSPPGGLLSLPFRTNQNINNGAVVFDCPSSNNTNNSNTNVVVGNGNGGGGGHHHGHRRNISLIDYDDSSDEENYMEDVDMHSTMTPMTPGGGHHKNQRSFEDMFTSIWSKFSSPAPPNRQTAMTVGGGGTRPGSPSFASRGDEMAAYYESDEIMNVDGCGTDDASCHDDMQHSCNPCSVTGDYSYHTKQVDEELLDAAKKEYEELQETYLRLREEYDSCQLKMTDLTAELEESNIKSSSAEKKAELREDLLRDVIEQYKELQSENSASKEQLQKMRHKVSSLLQLQEELTEEKKKAEEKAEAAAVMAEAAAKVGVVKMYGKDSRNKGNDKYYKNDPPSTDDDASQQRQQEFLQEQSRTFDTSDDCTTAAISESGYDSSNPATSAASSDDDYDEEEVEDERNDDGEDDSMSCSASSTSMYTANGLDKKFVMEDYKRLESECDRLQHEFDSAVSKITSLEEELEEAKKEKNEYRMISTEKSRKIALLEKEKFVLQGRIIEVTNKIVDTQSTHTRKTVEIDDELKLVEFKYERAREKQMEREQDLWDVIDQYKALAETNDTTTKEKAEVEKELLLTQKVKIQRRDLVYEYRKLEKMMEESVQTAEHLAKELLAAKNDAAKNKEESKSIRKRLAGCHFHYKHLQEQYDALLKEKDNVDRLLKKAQRNENLKEKQIESWQWMMDDLREKRRGAIKKVETLTKENEQLNLYCNELMEMNKLQREIMDQEEKKEEEEANTDDVVTK